jgi:hypothetical protein
MEKRTNKTVKKGQGVKLAAPSSVVPSNVRHIDYALTSLDDSSTSEPQPKAASTIFSSFTMSCAK